MNAAESTVRLATAEDVPALLRLDAAVDGAPHWSEAMYRERIAGDREGLRAGAVLVADRDGELLGYVTATVVAGVGEVEAIAVAASAQRRGWGRRLLAEAMVWMQRQGAGEVTLEVRASNAVARALYAAAGFAVVGTRKGYYAHPAEDAVLMTVKLP